MQAVVFQNPGHLAVEQRSVPSAGPGEVLLRVEVAAVCQTDVHIVQGHFVVKPPRVLGHELAGEVVAVGPNVSAVRVGQQVAVNPPRFCGECVYCRRGQPQHCQRFQCLGNTADGGWAEYALVPADQLVPLDGLTMEQAVWLEPLSCVLRAMESGERPAPENVLIVGAGPLGLLAVQVARTQGAKIVAIVDPNAGKLQRAVDLGADCAPQVSRDGVGDDADAALDHVAPLGFDLVFDTTGKSAALARALRWVGRSGTIIFFGVSDPADQLTLEPALVMEKEITLRGYAGSTPESFDRAVALMRTGRLNTAPLIWRRVTLAELPATVQALTQPGEKGKVFVYPNGVPAA